MTLIGLLLITYLQLQGRGVQAAVYKYIGCYADNSASRDLTGPSSTLNNANVTTDSCFSDCQKRGYAYAGLQGGNMCYCGNSFGYYGISTTGCRMSCDDKECGDVNANSIYYTIDQNTTVDSTRSVIYVGLTQPFSAARMDCVAHNGDLVALYKQNANESAEIVRDQNSKVTKVWVGLRKNDSTDKYEWVNPAITKYDVNSPDGVQWKDEQVSSACVLFDVNALRFESAPCNVPFAYLCRSVAWSDPVPYTPSPPSTGNSKLVLYIILPIFLFCYGGSCIVYCIHKILKHCRTKKLPRTPLYQKTSLSAPIPVLYNPPIHKSVEIPRIEEPEGFKSGFPVYNNASIDVEKRGKIPGNQGEMRPLNHLEMIKGDRAQALPLRRIPSSAPNVSNA